MGRLLNGGVRDAEAASRGDRKNGMGGDEKKCIFIGTTEHEYFINFRGLAGNPVFIL